MSEIRLFCQRSDPDWGDSPRNPELKRGDKVSSHADDENYVPPSHEQIQDMKKRTQVAGLLASITTPQALKDAKKEIAGLKRNMNRELRAARRAGESSKAKQLETTLSNFKQQIAELKNLNERLFTSNASLQNDLDAAKKITATMKEENEKLLSIQAELVEQLRAHNNDHTLSNG